MTWTVVRDADFTSAPDTSVGGAGTTTGSGLSFLTDINGNMANVSTHRLKTVQSTGTAGYAHDYLLTPGNDTVQTERIVVTIDPTTTATFIWVVLRWQSTGNCYLCGYNRSNGQILCYTVLGGTPAQIGSASGIAWDGSSQYTLDFSATFVDNSTTSLAATLTKAGGSSATLAAFNDTTSVLQPAGRLGVSGDNTGSTFITHITTYQSPPGLTIGTLTAAGKTNGIQLSLSVGLSGGSGSGYQYAIYRDTQPAVATTTPLATVSSMPYTDTTIVAGVQYYYKLVGSDSSSNIANAVPASLTGVAVSSPLNVTAQVLAPGINLVLIGDSITAGTVSADPGPDLVNALSEMTQVRSIQYSNAGHGGTSLSEWAQTGSAYNGVWYTAAASTTPSDNSSAYTLSQSYPSNQLVFSIMLGTNDSTTNGLGAGVGTQTAAQYKTNLASLVSRLSTDWPNAKIIVHYPIWFSPNISASGVIYDEAAQARLITYFPMIDQVVGANPGKVYAGDRDGYNWFAANYTMSGLYVNQSGSNGTYYLHPSSTSGNTALTLFWAAAINSSILSPSSASTLQTVQSSMLLLQSKGIISEDAANRLLRNIVDGGSSGL
jgi:lysophospholipase L1-like esterase